VLSPPSVLVECFKLLTRKLPCPCPLPSPGKTILFAYFKHKKIFWIFWFISGTFCLHIFHGTLAITICF
jgi:hypothetical protein